MLSPRKETILRTIVSEHISTVMPVASETIAHKYRLGVSSATVRSEVARLEEEGYINRPHISAGSLPTDQGYRYYVECLLEEVRLSEAEKSEVKRFFQTPEWQRHEWLHLVASLLAELAGNAALVSPPRATQAKVGQIELVSLHKFLVLLIVVLQQAKLKQQLLPTEEAVSQDELTLMANKLNASYKGLNHNQMLAKRQEVSPFEERVINKVQCLLQDEDNEQAEEPCVEGLRYTLGQPEFASTDQMLELVEMLEERTWLKSILSRRAEAGRVKVIIGSENSEGAMQRCSLVIARYGVPGQIAGSIGVIGPTRMPYARTIATVQYISDLLGHLSREVSGVVTPDTKSETTN
jgi:heat-inducible transcriptional repressor